MDKIETVLDRDVGTAEMNISVLFEREAFLLRELIRFIYNADLVEGKEDRVHVVGARKTWPEYQKYGFYFYQPRRTFKPVSYLAFYTDGEFKPTVPRVTGAIESIELTEATVKGHPDLSQSQREQLLDAVTQLHAEGSDRYGDTEKVIFLEEREELAHPITNDKTASDSDRSVAFVQGHRYVSFSTLQEHPKYTSELEEAT